MGGDGVSLDILIKTLSDTQGAAAVQQALDRIKQSGEKAKAPLHDAGKEVELFTTHGKDMHKLIHALNEVVPGLGLVLRAAVHPAGLGIAATVMLVREMVKHTEELKKKLEEAAKAQGAIEVGVWRAHEEALFEAAKQAQEFSDKLKKIAENTDALKQKEELELAVLKAQQEVREKLAASDAAKAMVAQRGKLDQIKLLEHQKSEQEAAARGAEVRLAGIDASRAGLSAGASQAAAAQEWLTINSGALPEAAAKLRLLRDGAQGKTPQELRNTAARIKAQAASNPGFSGQAPAEVGVLMNQAKELEKAEKEMHELMEAERSAKAAIKAHETATEHLNKAQEEATAELDKWVKAARGTGAEIGKEKAIFGIQGAGQLAERLQGAGRQPYNRTGQSLAAAIMAEEAVGLGMKLDKGQTAAVSALYNSAHSQGVTDPAFNKLLKALQDKDMTFITKLEMLEKALRIQIPKVNTANSHPQ